VSHKSGSISPPRKSGWRGVCFFNSRKNISQVFKTVLDTSIPRWRCNTNLSDRATSVATSSVPLWCFALHMASVNLSTACWPQTHHHLYSREQSRLCLTSRVQSVHHTKVVGEVFVFFNSRKNISQVFITVLDTSIPRWR